VLGVIRRWSSLDDWAVSTGEHTGFQILDAGDATESSVKGGVDHSAGALVAGGLGFHDPTLAEG